MFYRKGSTSANFFKKIRFEPPVSRKSTIYQYKLLRIYEFIAMLLIFLILCLSYSHFSLARICTFCTRICIMTFYHINNDLCIKKNFITPGEAFLTPFVFV